MSLVFPFDPNIERASTIPARVYNDPVFLELERERIFARTWQLVGRTDEVREHGQFFTAQVGNDPIVVLRDGETLRGFYNVCLHRAGPVASGCGKRNTLQCRYHGWTYSLDGTLKRAPEMEGVQRFSPDEMHLVPVQVATWGPLVLVNVDGKAPPLLDVLEDLPTRLAPFHCESMQWVMRKEWEIACNWKIYVDNYLEGYHVPVVHPADPAQFRAYTAEAVYAWLFPNTMLNVYLGQMQTNIVLPLGHDRCKVVFEWYAEHPPADAKNDPSWTKLLAFSDEIQDEDVEICEIVQRNLRSRVYDRGRYAAKRENGVHHFHSLLHEFLT